MGFVGVGQSIRSLAHTHTHTHTHTHGDARTNAHLHTSTPHNNTLDYQLLAGFVEVNKRASAASVLDAAAEVIRAQGTRGGVHEEDFWFVSCCVLVRVVRSIVCVLCACGA